ncbi:MAG: protein translocase subunit SecD [Minwuiales bacterium]|nr:protein translocase subunit SecD [Minwuiales bacterium]
MLYFAKWKIAGVLAVCLLGIVLTLPNLLPRNVVDAIPDWLPNQQINLGLDLQGGSHLLLEVDVDSVIRDRFESLEDEVRLELRQQPRIGYRGLGVRGDTVTLTIRDPAEVDDAVRRLRAMAIPVNANPLLGIVGGTPNIEVSASGSAITVELTQEALRQRVDSAVRQSVEIVRRRIDETGVNEPSIQRQGGDRILIQLPGVDDPDRIKRLLGETAKMTFHLVDMTADPTSGRIPPGSRLLQSDDPDDPIPSYVVRKRVEVSGENLVDAQPTYDQGQPVVSFRFDAVGAKRFADTTAQNVGRPFAIVLDDKVVSAPRINEPILQGSGIITGNFTPQTANDLALLLRAGALPAPLEILEERTVGPDLGADSIQAGKVASAIGFALVIIFMAIAYGLFGLAANAALITNMFMIFGVLSLLQATLTLPGIAGIVLTIGMAVDANVLIFERIREELRAGKSPFNAVEAGYKRAFTTIVDANVTTGIAAIILFAFGSGPVKGFAVTLGIGIVSSMFTATVLTRMLVSLWMRRTRPTALAL